MTTDTYLKRAEIRIERRFDAPPSRVFSAWTNPETVSKWIWAGLGDDVWAECDVRVGGAYRVYTNVAGGQHQGAGWSGMCGIYVQIVADAKLVFTLHWDADVGYNQDDALALDEVVSVELSADGDGTLMRFAHLGIPDDGVSADTHRAGIEKSFDMLAELIA